jgi:hypothetical protein
MSSLLTPLEMPAIDGIKMPVNLYVVLKEPSLLAGMSYPDMRTPWENISKAGFSGVICLCDSETCYNPYPLKLLFAVEMEDLHFGNPPQDPDTGEELVRLAVKVVRREMNKGKGVVIHCIGGRGRTGTVLGCVLREIGFSADEVINYLDQINRLRGFRGWPETEWQAEMVRKY